MTSTVSASRWFIAALLTAACFGQNQTTGNTPADKMRTAVRLEDQRHTTRLAAIETERVDADNEFSNNLVTCDGKSACVAAAHRTLNIKLRQIAIESNNEDATHTKNMIDIPARYGFSDIYGNRAAQ